MEQLFSGRGRELIEHVTSSVGKRATESQYFLELYVGVQSDPVGTGRTRCRTPGGSRGSGEAFLA